MKKIYYIALASLIASITLVSCAKEETPSQATNESTVLAATIGQVAETKTNLSGATEGATNVSIVWTANDKLSVLNGTSYGANSEFTLKSGDAGKASGSFTGASISGDIIAVYPYASDVAYSTDKVTLNIPKTQAYTNATFAQNSIPMVAKGTVGTPLTFNYLFSAIAFKIAGTGKSVTKITVAATTPLWGPAEISNLDSTPTIAMTGTDSKYNTVELTFDSAESIDSDKVFYIAVPAGSYTFAVNVYCGSEVFHESYTTAKTFTIGKIKYNATAKSFSDNGPAYVEGTYIGEGTKIGSTWWAPVNCGYDATHTYGRLYQFGRKIGTTYGPESSATSYAESGYQTTISEIPANTSNPDDGKFYLGDSSYHDWYSGTKLTLWPMGSGDTGYLANKIDNPCPTGWRVPINDEMSALRGGNLSGWTTGTQNGAYFNGTSTCTASTEGAKVFLPAAGVRSSGNGIAKLRGENGLYWTTTPYGNAALILYFEDGNAISDDQYRATGCSVRCVKE